MKNYERLKNLINNSLVEDIKRIKLQYFWIYAILAVVSALMTILNIVTEKYILMCSTAIFSVLCIINCVITKINNKFQKIAGILFSFEIIALFLFFLISGIPEGFSAIWICLLPSSGLLLFQRKRGTILSAIMFIFIVILCWTPFGQKLLQYEYTASFKLRFPFLYLAFYCVSFFLETIRALTYEKLYELQNKYEYLYSHDALTNVYNRYGFNEKLKTLVKNCSDKDYSLFIVDIDKFKSVNDNYGHLVGDETIKQVAHLLTEQIQGNADVCRWGGEEFAVLYTGKNAELKCNNFLDMLRNFPILVGEKELFITVSIGLVNVPKGIKADAEELVKAADKMLYHAKNGGRNKIESIIYQENK